MPVPAAFATIALLGTRVLVAAIFLWHGIPKATDFPFAADKFVGFGLPGWMGPLTGIVESAAGLLLLAGLFTRGAAVVLVGVILGALITVQFPQGAVTAGLERDLLILLALGVVLAFGPGGLSVDRARVNGVPDASERVPAVPDR